MPKFRLRASAWVIGSDTDFGVEEFDNEEDAVKAAFESACERIDAWAEPVEDDDTKEARK